jgi:hypothetical protein
MCRRKMRMSGLSKVEMSGFMGVRRSHGTERIALSQRERDRLRVLHEAKHRQITQVEAARRLQISDRQVRRLLLRLWEQGDRALIHGLRGRPSNRRLAPLFEQRILARVRQRYADFGPTLAAEHLVQEGLLVSRETLRKWMAKASLWRPRAQRVKSIHVWRERRASFGELVMQDSPPFRWLEDRGPACQLIALIDDATSRIGHVSANTTPRKRICEPWGYGYAAMDALSLITPIKTASSARLVQWRSANNYGEKKPLAVRTGPQRTGDRMDRGAQSPGKRAHRATVRDTARPSGEGNALGRNRYHRDAGAISSTPRISF